MVIQDGLDAFPYEGVVPIAAGLDSLEEAVQLVKECLMIMVGLSFLQAVVDFVGNYTMVTDLTGDRVAFSAFGEVGIPSHIDEAICLVEVFLVNHESLGELDLYVMLSMDVGFQE